MEEHDDSGFQEHKLLILDTMNRLEAGQQRFNDKMDAINAQLVELKVKAGFAGAAAGILAGALVSWLLKK